MKCTAILVALAATAAAMFTLSPQVPMLHQDAQQTIAGEYIVVYRQQEQLTAQLLTQSLLDHAQLSQNQVIRTLQTGVALRNVTYEQLERLRERSAEVEFIEPNQVYSVRDIESPVPSVLSCHYHAITQSMQWGLARISQEQFTNKTVYAYPAQGGEGVDAYVIDTGINIEHQDFEGRAVWGVTIPERERDTDGLGHGTHVAGTIGGKTYGVAKKVTLIAVKVLNSRGSGTTSDVIAGIEWAAAASQKSGKKSLANMSLGGGQSTALNRAVEAAIAGGMQFAVAAGNSNANACYSSPSSVATAVCVGASNIYDKRAYFSNYGQDITSAWIGSADAEQTISGTSMSCPHVAGSLALLLGASDETLTPAQLKDAIVAHALTDYLSGVPSDTVNKLLNIAYNETSMVPSNKLYW